MAQTDQARPELLTQAAPLETVDQDTRTAEVIFSTGALVAHRVQHNGQVRRMPTRLVLSDGACDLDFLRQSGPVLRSHMQWSLEDVIGTVEDASISDGQARARIRFLDHDDVDAVWTRVQQGVLRNISAGFEVIEQELREEDGPNGRPMDVMYFTRWRPVELSVVAVPADKGSFIQSRGKSFVASATVRAAQAAATIHEETNMEPEEQGAAGTAQTQQAAPPAATQGAAGTVDADAIRTQAAAEERARVQAITRVGERLGVGNDMVTQAIDNGTAVYDFQTQAIDAFAAQGQRDTQGLGGPRAQITGDARDRFRQGAVLGVMARAGMQGGERNEFTGMTMAELARQSLDVVGVRAGADRRQMVGAAFVQTGGAHSTSDFAHVLSNLAHRAALRGWEEQQETFQLWTRAGALTDFRPAKRAGLGLAQSLALKEEGGEYQHGTVGDRGEAITLATYGRIYQITREAIINDDLSLLTGLPTRMGRAARRTIGNLAYAVLTGNPTMADGTALFDAAHKNLAASGEAPSVTTLAAARAAMRTQVERAGGPSLNITPRYLIVPAAHETLATQLMRSTVDPTATKGQALNPVAGMAEVVVDGRLDQASTSAWYMAADPNTHDTVEVAYLDGVQEPFIEEETAWSTDGVKLKVRIDAGVKALDHRGLYKNAGT